jgi:hypothetical protein
MTTNIGPFHPFRYFIWPESSNVGKPQRPRVGAMDMSQVDQDLETTYWPGGTPMPSGCTIIVQGLSPQYYVKEIRLNGETLRADTVTLMADNPFPWSEAARLTLRLF